jgi:hypothetical protein
MNYLDFKRKLESYEIKQFDCFNRITYYNINILDGKIKSIQYGGGIDKNQELINPFNILFTGNKNRVIRLVESLKEGNFRSAEQLCKRNLNLLDIKKN